MALVKSGTEQENPDGRAVFVDDYLFISRTDTANIAKYGIDTSDGKDYYLFNESAVWKRYFMTASTTLKIIRDLNDISKKREVGIWEFRIHVLSNPIWAEVTLSTAGDVLKIEQVYYP